MRFVTALVFSKKLPIYFLKLHPTAPICLFIFRIHHKSGAKRNVLTTNSHLTICPKSAILVLPKGGSTIYEIIILCFGAWLTGVSKAGFGGGIGMIVVPMFTHFRSARNVIGLMLLLLFSTDIFSLRYYWKLWHRQSVTPLTLGSLFGIVLASLILKDISDVHLKKVIGGIACLFALLEFLRPYWQPWLRGSGRRVETTFHFKTWQGLVAGIFAGVFSTLAHMVRSGRHHLSSPTTLRQYHLCRDHNRHLFSTQHR